MQLGFDRVEMGEGAYELLYLYPEDILGQGGILEVSQEVHKIRGLKTDSFHQVVTRLALNSY
jgi:hypothetical protein